ncbi:MAG: hypothetical protein WKG06_41355 [Segetibacter sp.]
MDLTGSRLRIYLIKDNFIEEQKLNIPQGIEFSDMVHYQNGLFYLSAIKAFGYWIKAENLYRLI